MAEWLSRDEAQRLTGRVLALSTAEGCQVSVGSGVDGNTRFAANEISTSGGAVVVPPLVAREFMFSSISEAV